MFRRMRLDSKDANIYCPYVSENDLPELSQSGPFYFYKKIPDDICLIEISGNDIIVKFMITENWSIATENKINSVIKEEKISDGVYLYNILEHVFIYDYTLKKILDTKSMSRHPAKEEKGGPKNTCLVFDRDNLPYRIFKHGNLDCILYAATIANDILYVNSHVNDFGVSIAMDLILHNEFLPETPIADLKKHIEKNADFFFTLEAKVPPLPNKLFTDLDTTLAKKEEEVIPKKISLIELVDKKFNIEGEFIVDVDLSGFPFKNNPNLSMKYKDKKVEIISPAKTATDEIFKFMSKVLGFTDFSITERSYDGTHS